MKKNTGEKSFRQQMMIRIALLTTSLCFIVAGIMREEHLVVLKKAVKICLECIGVG